MNTVPVSRTRGLGEVEPPVKLSIERLRELVYDLDRARNLGVKVFQVKHDDIAHSDPDKDDVWFMRSVLLVRRLKGQEHEYFYLAGQCFTPVEPSPNVKGLIVQVI